VTVPAAPRAPGVDIEWTVAGPDVPAAVRTDVVGFVGLAQRGPVQVPVRIASWSHFQVVFGGYDRRAWLAFAVNGFFANGGNACWVVRVADPDAVASATAPVPAGAGRPLIATATSPGTWADGTRLSTVDLGNGMFWLAIESPDAQEVWPQLSLDVNSPRYFERVVNDPARGSAVITLSTPAAAPAAAAPITVSSGTATLSGGADGLATLQLRHFAGDDSPPGTHLGLAALDAVEEVGLVTIPDAVSPPHPDMPQRLSPADLTSLCNALLVHCAARRRFALLDQPAATDSPKQALDWAATLQACSAATAFGALGYPWIAGPDPFGAAGDILRTPPSGHLAGIFARTDLTVGVHKAPANATVVGARDVAWTVDPATHALLNDGSISVITVRPGRGIRLMGARTLDPKSPTAPPTWRYVNVRRLVSMIELSLVSALRWLVFEPNTPATASDVEREVRAFLLTLWERGALDGAQASDAMSVRCDATTMTADDIDNGRLICLVGVQPPIPAEFVTVRIAISEAGVQVTGEQGRTALLTPAANRPAMPPPAMTVPVVPRAQ
jgi:phage tail sheath protein FI